MKKVYAVALVAPARKPYTAMRLYPARPGDGSTSFHIVNDDGEDCYCLWKHCAHLDGGNWTRVELDVPPKKDAPAKVDEANLRLQQAEDKLSRVLKALEAAMDEAYR